MTEPSITRNGCSVLLRDLEEPRDGMYDPVPTLSPYSVTAIIGRRCSGKSTLARYLINKYIASHQSDTYRVDNFYTISDLGEPGTFQPTAEVLEAIQNSKQNTVVLWDDSIKRLPDELIFNGRHRKITTIIVAQDIRVSMRPLIRRNLDLVIVTDRLMTPCLRSLYECQNIITRYPDFEAELISNSSELVSINNLTRELLHHQRPSVTAQEIPDVNREIRVHKNNVDDADDALVKELNAIIDDMVSLRNRIKAQRGHRILGTL